MTSDQSVPTVIEWELTDSLERAVWGTTFAVELRKSNPKQAAARANEAVKAISTLTSERSLSDDPILRASHAAIDIVRADFEIWYRVELQLHAGRWRQNSINPTDNEIDAAFERYLRGRSDYY